VTYAAISSGVFGWILLGLGAGVWGTIWWELRQKPTPTGEDEREDAAESRAVTIRRCAVAYFVIIVICFCVALIAGGEGVAVLTAINVVIAAIVLLRSWPPGRRKDLLKEIVSLYRGSAGKS
jgi:hypothetical protein